MKRTHPQHGHIPAVYSIVCNVVYFNLLYFISNVRVSQYRFNTELSIILSLSSNSIILTFIIWQTIRIKEGLTTFRGLLPKQYYILLRSPRRGCCQNSNYPHIRMSAPINTEGKNRTPASPGFDPNYHPQYIIRPLSIYLVIYRKSLKQ